MSWNGIYSIWLIIVEKIAECLSLTYIHIWNWKRILSFPMLQENAFVYSLVICALNTKQYVLIATGKSEILYL